MFDYKYKVLIIDDEPSAVELLVSHLKQYPDFIVEGMALNASTGIKLIESVKPDLLFLDVEMPDMYGMELLLKVRDNIDWDMRVVFHTAYNKYMIDALRSSAFDFLLKPVDPQELDNVIKRFVSEFSSSKGTFSSKDAVKNHTDIPFMITTPTGDLRMIKVSEIGFFRYVSTRKIWEAVLSGGEALPLKRNTSAEFLCGFDNVFVQVHQSYIVNLNYLVMLQDNHCVMYPPFDEYDILVSRKYKKQIIDRFCAF